MASVLLLAVFLLSGSFPARAQDTRTDQAGSVLREYVDKGYCTYTYVVPPGSRTEGCTPPGQTTTSTAALELQLTETKEETGRLKNQVDRLSSLVETLLSQQSDLTSKVDGLGDRLESEQNMTRELQEKETHLQAQVQNLTTTLYEQDVIINQRLQCACESRVPGDVISSTTVRPPPDHVTTAVAETGTAPAGVPTTAAEPIGAVIGLQLQVRLADGRAPLEGRVEVRNGTGQWGSVCDDRWDLQDAHVVCRQLGFGTALEVKLAGHFGEGSGNVWLDEVACRGDETNLGDCSADSWGRSDCVHKEDAGVICGENVFRLVGGRTPWEGRVEFRPEEKSEWGAVCNTSWTEADARVVCRQLGHTGGVTSPLLPGYGEGTGRIWLGDVTCSGEETNILSCGFTWEPSDCDHSQDAAVVCTGNVSVRLAGSQSPLQGRVEIRAGNGDWGTICDDGFDDRDAQVVCRQLGYHTGFAREGGVYPEGTGNIWLDNLNCAENESSVADCQIDKWGDHDCTHKEDAGVICEASDCADHFASGQTTSGVYNIRFRHSDVEVYCDMDTEGGGWTVIQRRQDGSVPFNRTWEEYKKGFGNKNGEYWLGNENIHLLTSQKNYKLRVDLLDWSGGSRFAECGTFRVSGESNQYRLHVAGYTGTAGDFMAHFGGQKFSTVDRDNYISSRHCSQRSRQAGWWFTSCGASNLNGRYLGNCGSSCPGSQGVLWPPWRGHNYSLKSVSMKIKPY